MQDKLPTTQDNKALNRSQEAFSSALLKPDAPLPGDVVGPSTAKKAQKRFGVYRNNVVVSLSESLMATYPTILAMVGEEFFRAMAREFVTAHPPQSAILAHYGAGFGGFMDTFEPVSALPYLGDVARLEFAWLIAYNAKDNAPLAPENLQTIDPEHLADLTFDMHPACQLLSCSHAAYSIWAAHKQEDPAGVMANLTDHPEDILITRPQWDVTVISLPAGGYAFIKALSDGESLGEAATQAAKADSAFNFAQNLGGLLETGALANVHLNNP